MQALILAGGAGTRLRAVLGDALNKPMAPVAEKPFLEYLVLRLKERGVDNIVLCVGYKAEVIEAHFGDGARWGVPIQYSRETEFLGTGGAVKLAENLIDADEFLALNGDSFFDIDLDELARFHHQMGAAATLALAQVENASRYGAVQLDERHRIVGFAEKSEAARAGLINGGIYLFSRAVLALLPQGQVCSLERELFPTMALRETALASGGRGIYGRPCSGFFIDIGVPADYARLQADPSPLFAASKVN